MAEEAEGIFATTDKPPEGLAQAEPKGRRKRTRDTEHCPLGTGKEGIVGVVASGGTAENADGAGLVVDMKPKTGGLEKEYGLLAGIEVGTAEPEAFVETEVAEPREAQRDFPRRNIAGRIDF